MINASRRWFRRNKTPIAVGAGIIGFGYVATQYLLGKLSDARERISGDRIAREKYSFQSYLGQITFCNDKKHSLRRRFEQNQEDCTHTVLALLPTVTVNILAELETEKITFELQQQKAAKLTRTSASFHRSLASSETLSATDEDGRSILSLQSESGVHASQLVQQSTSNIATSTPERSEIVENIKKSKLELWNALKISAITRSFTLIYTLSLLTLLTRTQLNLLGRRSYLSSVISMANSGTNHQTTINLENHDDDNPVQEFGNEFEINRTYLTFSWWLLNRGWKGIMHKVEAAVEEVFGTLSPRDELSMAKFSELTLEVRKKIEGSTESIRKQAKWLEFLLPPRDEEDLVLKESGNTDRAGTKISSEFSPCTNSALRRLLDETSDLIESPPFTHVITLLLDDGFSTLVDQKVCQQAYKIPPVSENPDIRVQEILDTKPVKLPIILAVLTRQAHAIGNGNPNEYLQSMEQVRELEAFAAVVYSSNWESVINPISRDAEIQQSIQGYQENDSVLSPSLTVEESLIDVGTFSRFESAWETALDASE
ncbi:Peroxisomal biogenesis factor 3 [Golovinomyces cichoracearum]|uniref:Peroxisomal biogenesis factor 3 n=1 Tax=Golovinomyces cichoracearum TaxID=62708 RepID=A0A420HHT3_9PEZI|nr:Peroxisomal biogenesis factor 3 [Golovinomyces cichoracearum]